MLDVIKTDNEFLKKFVFEEGSKLIQASQDFATEHEDRMIEGLCLPQAAPIFLAILDKMLSYAPLFSPVFEILTFHANNI